MAHLSFFTSKGGELLYNFFYLAACLIVILMLFYESRRTKTRESRYLLYAFVVMLANMTFINLTLAQEIFFGAPRSYFWFPIITWNLQALSLIFITGAFIYPVAHKRVWLQKYLSYNITILSFSFCIITPLWLNKYYQIVNYNLFWGAYYYNIWMCLILILTILYLHFYNAEFYPDILLRAFMGVLLLLQITHLWRVIFPNSSEFLIILQRTLPLLASFILVLTIYRNIVSSLIKSNQNLALIRQQLDHANQELERKVIERTRELTDANKELLRFKDFHENILESLTDGILAVDSRGRILAVNRAAEENLYVTNSSVSGEDIDNLLPSPRGNWQELINQVINEDESIRLNKVEFKLSRINEPVIVNILAQPLKDKEFKKIGIIITLEFITEKVKMEDKIKRSEKLAYMGQIAAGVAHEIRNPLNSISINLQLFRRFLQKNQSQENESQLEQLKIVNGEISRLDGIISEFINFARPKKINLSKGNINQIIEEIIILIDNQAKMAQVMIDKELDSQIPEILLDESKIKQVFLNMGINSIQAMPDGGPLKFSSMRVKNNDEPEYICVKISDKGKGINDADLKKIFEPFFSSKQDGIGLGLAIALQIIEEHNGGIFVESKLGEGTTFSIHLPIG